MFKDKDNLLRFGGNKLSKYSTAKQNKNLYIKRHENL